MKRTSGIAFILFVFSLSLCLLARENVAFADAYSHAFYVPLSRTVSTLIGIFPFSVAEFLIYLLILLFTEALLRLIVLACRRHFREMRALAVHGALFAVSLSFLLSSLYFLNCGINYYRSSFASEIGLTTEAGDPEELKALVRLIVSRVSESENDGGFPSGGKDTSAPADMEKLGKMYPGLSGHFPRAKALLNSRFLSERQFTGIYSPFTFEANYNAEIPCYNVPFTACHELSHLRGYMQEDEANFIAFLACIGSDDPRSRYSGWLSAFVYCGNDLARVSPEDYASLYSNLSENSRTALSENNAFWNQFRTKTAERAEKANDAYLRANGQTDGTESYSRVTDLILAYYLAGRLSN